MDKTLGKYFSNFPHHFPFLYVLFTKFNEINHNLNQKNSL
jgi:hypothetical protein